MSGQRAGTAGEQPQHHVAYFGVAASAGSEESGREQQTEPNRTPTATEGDVKRTICVVLAASVPGLFACEGAQRTLEMGVDDAPVIPPVRGYAAGEPILFLHTEASDPEIAEVLTEMMRSPVLVVPELAQVPETTFANVYVFANGVQPEAQGPLGYQPDVFDCPPPEGCYTPLRAVHLVTWVNPDQARVLESAAEVRQAEEQGDVTTEQPGVVVNMPFVTWSGGER